MKKWDITQIFGFDEVLLPADFITSLLRARGLKLQKEIDVFLTPPNPITLSAKDVGIDAKQLSTAVKRIVKAIQKKESIVVYADYDADGITAGAVMWETLWELGARVMPYIPHRVDEGYGLSQKGIDAVREQFDPTLIITVDHGITAREMVEYAKKFGIEVIISDHHVKPEKVPDTTIVHTTELAGSGVSWFLAKEVFAALRAEDKGQMTELLALTTIGTIADLVPLVGPNRSIVKFGLVALSKTKRVGIRALMTDAAIDTQTITPYSVSHALAPRLNAMGRIEHALDALRLLCTKQADKAGVLATQLGLTNKQRQQMTEDYTTHALNSLIPSRDAGTMKKLLFVYDQSYNQGVIGLVAGRLVEQYYRPAIVLAVGEEFSKASARSVAGFNIIEAIREATDLLVDAGGHPMAAGFTVATKNLTLLKERLEALGEKALNEDILTRKLRVDAEVPLNVATEQLWKAIQQLQPFGVGNPEPVLVSRNVMIKDVRLVGATKKHLKLSIMDGGTRKQYDGIGFNMSEHYAQLQSGAPVDIAYSLDMNEWNGSKKLQFKIKDIQFRS